MTPNPPVSLPAHPASGEVTKHVRLDVRQLLQRTGFLLHGLYDHLTQLHQVLYRLQAWRLVHCKPTHSVTQLTQLYQVLYHLQARGLVHCKLTHSVTHD